MLARRFAEAGVRFIEVSTTGWDQHSNLRAALTKNCAGIDQPIAALIGDLKQRGLLESTLVVWCTEFGRMPTFQKGASGRDHNPSGFTAWMAGAGVKPGASYGATDEFGYKAVENAVSVHDFHATILKLLGFDHERFTFKHQGLDQRLSGVEKSSVIDALLA